MLYWVNPQNLSSKWPRIKSIQITVRVIPISQKILTPIRHFISSKKNPQTSSMTSPFHVFPAIAKSSATLGLPSWIQFFSSWLSQERNCGILILLGCRCGRLRLFIFPPYSRVEWNVRHSSHSPPPHRHTDKHNTYICMIPSKRKKKSNQTAKRN